MAASSGEGATAGVGGAPNAEAGFEAADGDSFVDVDSSSVDETVLVTDTHGRALHAVQAPAAPGSVSVVYEIDAGDAERYGATFDACEPTLPVTFADVAADHPYSEAIGCAVYYEVMGATPPGMFSPELSVSRRELAVTLARLARRVGIGGTDVDVDASLFADLASPMQVRSAVDMLSGLGIVDAASAGRYLHGYRPASRGETATLVARLMDKMQPLSGTDGAGRRVAYGHLPAEVPAAGAPFVDLDVQPSAVRTAVERLWHLEVAAVGSVFAPGATLTRAELTGFAAAVLDHSNARPRGLAVQPGRARGDGTVDILISWRDDDFRPVAGRAVNVFHSTSPGEDLDSACAFADALVDGRCTVTDGAGNVYLRGLLIGDRPQVVLARPQQRPRGSQAEVEIAVASIPQGHSRLAVSSMLHGASAPYLAHVVQLEDDTGRAVARSGVRIIATVTSATGDGETHTDTDATGGFGSPHTVLAVSASASASASAIAYTVQLEDDAGRPVAHGAVPVSAVVTTTATARSQGRASERRGDAHGRRMPPTTVTTVTESLSFVTDAAGRVVHEVPVPPGGWVHAVYRTGDIATAVGPAEVSRARIYAATFDACESAALERFADVAENDQHVAGCAVYYEVMRAQSGRVFSPDREVSRGELAVTLARLARRVGTDSIEDTVDAAPSAEEQKQRAITALARLGIIDATTSQVPAGASAITGYEVQHRPKSAADWDNATSVTVEDEYLTSMAVDGLAADTAYVVRIRARNGAGLGEWSDASGTRTSPIVVPLREAPDPIVVPLREAPDPIVVPLREAPDPIVVPLREAPDPIVVPLREAPDPIVVPYRMSDPAVSAATGDGFTVEWDAASVPPGAPAIDGYAVQHRKAAAEDWSNPTTVAINHAAAGSLTVTGLDARTGYLVRIAARNASGTGAWSGAAAVTTADAPPNKMAAPTFTDATAGGFTVNWAAGDWFSSEDAVSRSEAAVFLARLMNRMPTLHGFDAEGRPMNYGYRPADVAVTSAPFNDVHEQRREVRDAIARLHELGVVRPSARTMFAPAAPLTRASLAASVAAILHHSVARPQGLHIQPGRMNADGMVDMLVSWRGEDFTPRAGRIIEFTASPARLAELDESGNAWIPGLQVGDEARTISVRAVDPDDPERSGPDFPQARRTIAPRHTYVNVSSSAEDEPDGAGRIFEIQLKDGNDHDVTRSGVTIIINTVNPLTGATTTTVLTTDRHGRARYVLGAPTQQTEYEVAVRLNAPERRNAAGEEPERGDVVRSRVVVGEESPPSNLDARAQTPEVTDPGPQPIPHTPDDVPGKVTGVTASSPTGAGFTVNWAAATVPTGAPAVSGYVVQHLEKPASGSPDWASDATSVDVGDAAARSAAVTGLDARTTYLARVAAKNASGTGAWSDTVEATTADAAPAKMAAPTFTNPAVGGFTVNWAAATVPAGATAVTGYTIQHIEKPASGSPDWNNATATAAAASATSKAVTGLQAATAYLVRVRASNGAGDGPWSDTAQTSTPDDVPGKVTGVTASSPTGAGFTVNWAAATVPTGAPAVSGYVVQHLEKPASGSPDWASDATSVDVGDAAARSAAVTGLDARTTYLARVAAKNASGTGAWSDTVEATTADAAPAKMAAPTFTNPAVGGFTVNWAAATVPAGATAVTGYTIQHIEKPASGSPDWNNATATAAAASATSKAVTGLQAATAYLVRVRASNGAGDGPWSDTAQTSTPDDVPGKVTGVTASSPTGAGFTVNWPRRRSRRARRRCRAMWSSTWRSPPAAARTGPATPPASTSATPRRARPQSPASTPAPPTWRGSRPRTPAAPAPGPTRWRRPPPTRRPPRWPRPPSPTPRWAGPPSTGPRRRSPPAFHRGHPDPGTSEARAQPGGTTPPTAAAASATSKAGGVAGSKPPPTVLRPA